MCNLSSKLSHFLKDCKVAKLKPLHKEAFREFQKILGKPLFF